MASDSLVLTDSEQLELSRIAQSRSLPAGYVFRARLILTLAEGNSYSTIKRRLGTTAPAISRWKQRFLAAGVDGLDTSHPGQPASVRGDLGKAVQQLKREAGKGLFVGGVKLPLALAELGLIDEYEFVVQPRLAGHGPTLFVTRSG